MEKLKMETPPGAQELFAKLAKLVPECVVEKQSAAGGVRDNNLTHAIDFDKLKQLLDDHVREGEEAYEFTWVGKKAALVEANTPIQKTLRPVKEESKDWDTTENLYIEGDNLDALKLLQESYLGKVKMIYIDPPYNTGNDFIYNDDFKQSFDEYEEESGHVDEDGNRMKVNHETDARFHSKWCSMIYSRLRLARNLLADDGVIFISIDDNEQANLKKICDEVFGADNFLASFPRVTKRGGKSSDVTARNHDYVLAYAEDINYVDLCGIAHNDDGYSNKDEFFESRGYYKANQTLDYDSLGYVKTLDYPIELDGEKFYAGGDEQAYINRQKGQHGRADWGWRWSKPLFEFGLENGFIEIHRGGIRPRIYTKTYQKVKIERVGNEKYEVIHYQRTKPLSTLEFTDNKYSNDNAKKAFSNIFQKGIFEYTKPISLIEMLLQLLRDKHAVVLDFFSGSATTAHAVMQLNAEDGGHRKFIMVQLPEATDEKSEAYKAGYKNICEIGKERIRRAGAKILAEHPEAKDLDTGFRVLRVDSSNMKDVYYRADEVTQASLIDAVDNVKEDRSALDLLFGCLVDWGLPLSLPYAEETIAGVPVLNYSDGDLIACFAAAVPEAAVRAIAERQPLRAVFRDSSFADSPARINVEEIFRLLSPDTDLRVL